MAPGSRIANLLPEQYWQSVGEDREAIEKAAGNVVDELKSRDSVNVEVNKVISNSPKKGFDGIMHEESELQHRSKSYVHENCKVRFPSPSENVLLGKKTENLPHFKCQLRRHRRLNVSSRLHQMMESSGNYDDKGCDMKEGKCVEDSCEDENKS